MGRLRRAATMGLALWGVWCAPQAMALEFTLQDGSVLKTDESHYVADNHTVTGPATLTRPNGTVLEGEMINGGWQGPVKVFVPATGLRFVSLYDKGVQISVYSELEADMAIGRYDIGYGCPKTSAA